MRHFHFAFAVTLVALLGANAVEARHTKPEDERHPMRPDTRTAMKSQTIELKKGEVFVIISSVTKQGAGGRMNEYFERVFPVASKHGFKPLASFPIDEVVTGNYRPNNFVGLYRWPDLQSIHAFGEELPPSILGPMRRAVWDELKQALFEVSEDFELTFHEDRLYEIQTLFADGSLGGENRSAVEAGGGKPLFEAALSGYEDLTGVRVPTRMVIIEWASADQAARSRRAGDGPSGYREIFYTHVQPTN